MYLVIYAIKNNINIKKAEVIENVDVYTLVGINRKGLRDLVGIYQDRPLNNRYWLDIFESLKSRGLNEVLFLAVDDNKILSKVKAPSAFSVNKGKSKALKITLPAGFTQVAKYTGSPADVKVTFKSSNPKVAKVSSSGKVTGKKKGTAKISISMQIKNGAKKTLTTKVIVK